MHCTLSRWHGSRFIKIKTRHLRPKKIELLMKTVNHAAMAFFTCALFGCNEEPEVEVEIEPAIRSVDTELFLEGALAQAVTTEECTLSGGTVTS